MLNDLAVPVVELRVDVCRDFCGVSDTRQGLDSKLTNHVSSDANQASIYHSTLQDLLVLPLAPRSWVFR
jgi:hypothetical protein